MVKRLFNASFVLTVFVLILNIVFVSGEKTNIPEIPNFEETMQILSLQQQYEYSQTLVLETGDVGFSIGTSVYPYIIANASQLMDFAKYINASTEPFASSDIHYKLVQNISLQGLEWIPIGNSSHSSFKGIFDGNSKTINGLTITENYSYQGFFGHTNGALIKNLYLENSSITGRTFIGGIVGFLSNSTLENSYANSNIEGLASVGGLVGNDVNGVIKNCYATGSVKAYGYSGGIIGDLSGTVQNCYATNYVYGDTMAGGIAGYSQGNITNSFAINTSLMGNADVARVVGVNDGSVTNNYALADLFTTSIDVAHNGLGVYINNNTIGTYDINGTFTAFDWLNTGNFNTSVWQIPSGGNTLLPILKVVVSQTPEFTPSEPEAEEQEEIIPTYYTIQFCFDETDIISLQTDAQGKIENFPTKTDYTIRWYDGQTEVTSETVFTENSVLTARFIEEVDTSLSPMWIYDVTIEKTGNGTVKVDDYTKIANQNVTIVATPDVGYKVSQITISKTSGNAIDVKDNGDGTYTYTQPFSDIIVDIVFEQGMQFVDVLANDWFYSYVENMLLKGLMVGVSNNTFSPHTSTDNAMILTMIWRLSENSAQVGSNDYEEAVEWAKMNNIIQAENIADFNSSEAVTREQIATYLYCYEGSPDILEDVTNNFADSVSISDWAKDAMNWAVVEGVFQGNISGNLNPTNIASRAEVATIFTRYLENVK